MAAAIGQATGEVFAFRENPTVFAGATESRIGQAAEAMRALLGSEVMRIDGSDVVRGKRMLDIGCGSGLHALAALRLGAAHVTAIDADPVCVETTRALLAAHAPSGRWETRVAGVFDLDGFGTFDVVWSWGVLHHTGDVRRALACASARVAPGGALAVAISRRTWLCRFWAAVKKTYSRSGPFAQRAIRSLYRALVFAPRLLRGRVLPQTHGLDFTTGAHEWLSGYPYESLLPGQVQAIAFDCGMTLRRANVVKGPPFGLTGTGCDAYVFLRTP